MTQSNENTEDVLPIYSNALNRHDESSHISHSSVTSPRLRDSSPSNDGYLKPYSNKRQSYTETAKKHKTPSNLPVHDRPRFALLVLLYFLQGIPVGLGFGSVPFILKSGQLTYSEIGIFSLASYPYSLKLLWSPIVDSIFWPKIGRRRSWIIPVQTISGLTLIFLGSVIDKLMEVDHLASNLYKITYVFLILVLLCATQDIAVDGWALTIISKEALSYASTAQTVGLNTGYFLSFTVFLAFNSPDFANSYLRKVPSDEAVISLGQYMTLAGFLYLIVTVLVAVFVPEDPPFVKKRNAHGNEEEEIELMEYERDLESVGNPLHSHTAYSTSNESNNSIGLGNGSKTSALWNVYKKMWYVVNLKNVRLFILIHLVSKIAFQANEAATSLKLLDKGFTREDLAISVLIDFPFEIIFGYYAGRWSTGDEPLRPWMYGYLGRIGAAILGQILVWCFPKSGKVSFVYFFFVILQNLFGSFMSTVQFVSICAFHNNIADPAIGGTYMTTLNTLSNLGGQWPKIIVLFLIDRLTTARCMPTEDESPLLNGNPFEEKTYFNCYAADNKKLCLSNGGHCKILQDGYYYTNVICICVGLALYFGWIRKTAKHLQSLPLGAWRVSRGESSLPQ